MVKKKLPPPLPADMGDDTLLTIDQAADRLHTHPVTLRARCARGEMPAVRNGRRWLIRLGTLREIARGSTPTPTN